MPKQNSRKINPTLDYILLLASAGVIIVGMFKLFSIIDNPNRKYKPQTKQETMYSEHNIKNSRTYNSATSLDTQLYFTNSPR